MGYKTTSTSAAMKFGHAKIKFQQIFKKKNNNNLTPADIQKKITKV